MKTKEQQTKEQQTKEQQIETAFIEKLQDLKYTYRPDIRDRASLEKNFREKFNALNKVKLSDSEFSRLRDQIITPDVFQASQMLREYDVFKRDDDTPLHYMLVNIKDWCKNEFEVINQLRINTENSHHRYDVILLINGIPMVQIELKTLGLTPRRAMEQIVQYKNDPGNGYTNSLLCFMQLFIVSNQNDTLYFANNKAEHFSFHADERFLPIYQLASEDNQKVTHLNDFSDKFLNKCTLGQMISRYMVLVATEQKLLIMRPYQIYAVKAIVDCIKQNRGNGYIWHTTGSGKTLTSFKASTLLKDNPDVDKCLFVVDRKDLDRQTREEFNKFQKDCVEENTNTATLVNRLLSDSYKDKVIVTTIQKLGLALNEHSKRNKSQAKKGKQTYKERLEPLRDKRIVFIFDECHRSQFGENHQAIKDFFPKAQLFGFTGTPIFEENASDFKIEDEQKTLKTTQDIFKEELHAYTITHAIEDKNVLRFNVDYFGERAKAEDLNPEDTNTKSPQLPSKKSVVEEILKQHDKTTNHRRFNAVFATNSINDAIDYYHLFKELQNNKQQEDEAYQPLNIACVFSPPVHSSKDGDEEGNKKSNQDVRQLQEDLPQEKEDNKQDPEGKKAALKQILVDYNQQYKTNHSINEFDLYYKDVQQRIKDHQYTNADYAHDNKIDITIVVDMLLTGFDSKYLNTLYVDKNLKYHGLIQAFSRTNRVLNDTKPQGQIMDFRHQKDAVDDAIALFSGVHKDQAQEIWFVDPASKVIEQYSSAITKLERFMDQQGLACTPDQVNNLQGDIARVEFIQHFKEVQRLKSQLDQYTDIDEDQEQTIQELMPEDELRGFKGMYLETAQQLKAQQVKGNDKPNDPVQEVDCELVLFGSALIDYDYIMGLIADSTAPQVKRKVTQEQLVELIRSNANFMDDREDLVAYIQTLNPDKGFSEQEIRQGYDAFKDKQKTSELIDMATRHKLAPENLQSFVDEILDRMIFDSQKLTIVMAPLGLSWKDRSKAEVNLMAELKPFLEKQAKGRDISGLSVYD